MSTLIYPSLNLKDSHFKAFKISDDFIPQTQSHTFKSELFLKEVDEYLSLYPHTQHIDICLHDLNGHIRGKRIDVKSLKNLSNGCYFPLSVYAMSLDGKVIEETGLGKYIGEPDRLCLPILGSLQPNALSPELNAQLYLSMQEEDGSDCRYEPRNILKKLLNQLHANNYFPIMAAELEFYLFSPQHQSETCIENQCFDIDAPNNYQQVLDEVEKAALLQSIEITAIVAESSLGQYELNLQHSHDILKLCDQINALKRIVKQVARKHDLTACFMAKPNLAKAGSGMHFHMSMLNQYHQNIFSSEVEKDELSAKLLSAISGLIELMPASMAILAPNINSYRRFKIGHHVPLEANWDTNNRNVAIRIPCSDVQNQRLEYRVAGADCNPYLVTATILAGASYGLSHKLPLPKPAHLLKFPDEHILLANNQPEALKIFKGSLILKGYLGADFVEHWYTVKQAEYQSIYSQMTEAEQHWDI
ncbi:glutamine synthetase family protein [Acinetobacter baumannii]|uniref:glutamine synthetase family protein n=1 Tax=Acinetobacter baumannii TaxID=470 RepID=UPI0022EB47B4|nr:glutamine synthetase family protein [Acinetobacter baumannii]MDA3481772.1 glutamine synthetase family protein [Acinetobacter baumannii]WGT83105.1 glutamine synthetase family protein [Acinetobacter baumannii]